MIVVGGITEIGIGQLGIELGPTRVRLDGFFQQADGEESLVFVEGRAGTGVKLDGFERGLRRGVHGQQACQAAAREVISERSQR